MADARFFECAVTEAIWFGSACATEDEAQAKRNSDRQCKGYFLHKNGKYCCSRAGRVTYSPVTIHGTGDKFVAWAKSKSQVARLENQTGWTGWIGDGHLVPRMGG